MNSLCRSLRFQCITTNIRPLRQIHFLYQHPSSPRQLHSSPRISTRAAQPHNTPTPHAKRSAFDPTTFLIAVTLATGVAYFTRRYFIKPISSAAPLEDVSEQVVSVAPSAHLYPLTMAPSMPPGRPGALTSEQEAKLKEMWLATLEIFGLTHDEHANGNAAPASESTPDGKKRKKSRLSMFRKGQKDTEEIASAGDTTENDKHGQTKEFQQALASLSPESIREAFWSMTKHDHPDALLLRFLRARKWDVHAALVMAISTLHWRMEDMKVDEDIMKYGEEGAVKLTSPTVQKEAEDFMAQLRMGKSFLHGSDKQGRPCCYCRVRLHRPGQQTEGSLERFTVFTIETTRMLLRPPVDTATIVFDMTDFSMSNMDYTPVKFMIKCFEANYPESLGSVLVYKAPWIFQGIWKIIKGWLDPVVASKVHFANNVKELEEFIPKSKIIKELGGDEDWTYQYVEPVEGENAAMADTASRDKMLAERAELVKSYESETLSWANGEDGGEGRGRLAERLAENYWRLDPFIRARSLYDRTAVLGTAGKLDFYPSAQGATGGGGASNDELD